MSQDSYADILDNEVDEQTPQGPQQLRDAHDKLKREKAALQKQLDDRVAADRSATVDRFVTEKGLPAEAKVLIGDQDPTKWFNDYSQVFGTPKPDEAVEPESAPETKAPTGESALTDEQQANIAAVTGVEALPFDVNSLADRDAYLDQATSLTDFEERLAKVNLLDQSHGARA